MRDWNCSQVLLVTIRSKTQRDDVMSWGNVQGSLFVISYYKIHKNEKDPFK